MCTGMELALISAAASGGGALMQGGAERRRNRAAEREAQAELDRQERLDSRRYSNFREALQGMDRDTVEQSRQQQASEAEGRIADFVGLNEGTPAAPAVSTSTGMQAPAVVQSQAEQGRQQSQDRQRQAIQDRSFLDAWGDTMYDTGMSLRDLDFSNTMLGNRARRSADIGRREAQEAYQNTGNTLADLGNLFSTAGTVGSFAAGGMGGWGDLFTKGGNAIGSKLIPASPYW